MLENKKTALFCGSFDPFQKGHLECISRFFEDRAIDRLIVVVCGSPFKQGNYMFSLREAGALTNFSVRAAGYEADRVQVITSTHSMLNVALDFGVDYITRGARTIEEKNYERDELLELTPYLPAWTQCYVYSMPSGEVKVSSSKVKGMVAEGMDVSPYVATPTKAALEEAILGHYRVAVVGNNAKHLRRVCTKLCTAMGDPTFTDLYEFADEETTIRNGSYEGAWRLNRELDSSEAYKDKLLEPYRLRARRQFLKKTDAKMVFLSAHSPEVVGRMANGFIVVVGSEDEETQLLEEKAYATHEALRHGKVFRIKDPGKFSKEKARDLMATLHLALKNRRSQYENAWAVPPHEEARRGGLWDDHPGRAHANRQNGLPQAGSDGES